MYCVTVSYGLVRGKAKQYRYYQPALYREHILKGGRKVWKYVDHKGTARRSLRLATKDAINLATELDCQFISGVRQYNIVK